MPWLIRFFAAGLLAGFCLGSANGQDTAQPASPAQPATPPVRRYLASEQDQNSVQSLEALQRVLAAKEAEAAALHEELVTTTDDMLREDVRQRLEELEDAIELQRQQFDGFAADIDLTPFIPQPESKFDWQEQLGKLLEPILAEFANATADSRVIGQLRTQLEDAGKRRDLSGKAVTNLTTLLQQAESPALRTRLEGRLDVWKRIFDQAANEYSALNLQLQSRLAEQESVLDQTTGYARRFFRTRGMNLLLGVGAFLAVFFAFRLGEALVRKLRRKGFEKKFSSRITALLFHVFSVLGGLAAMMLVFNMAGDWFMLGIIIIFLFGVGWASIKTLPQQVETIKLMLNIGAVREGEWILYDGTPYCVDSLGLAARLNNPRLDGGERRLPVKYLVGMTSRPVGEREAWFPCVKGDWVELADGRTGKVVSQTPACVELVTPGGERAVYQTPAFLGLNPKNLSGRFRITSMFGVDYRHQAEATTDIPAKMRKKLQAGLPELVGAENIEKVQVLFSRAGDSALEYTVVADLKGAAAPKAVYVPGTIQRLLVEACNENGWTIPFQQITIHQ